MDPSLADTGTATLRFAPEQHYPPFTFQDGDGQLRGLSMDVLKELQRRSDVVIETLPPQPLQHILQAVREGRADLVSSLRPDAERARYLNFSRPYVSVPAMLIMRPNSTHSQMRDLAGRSVAVGAGFGVSSFLTVSFPDVLQVPVPDDQAGRDRDDALARVPPATLQAIRERWLGRDFDPLAHAAGQRIRQVAWGLLAAGLLLLTLVWLMRLPKLAAR